MKNSELFGNFFRKNDRGANEKIKDDILDVLFSTRPKKFFNAFVEAMDENPKNDGMTYEMKNYLYYLRAKTREDSLKKIACPEFALAELEEKALLMPCIEVTNAEGNLTVIPANGLNGYEMDELRADPEKVFEPDTVSGANYASSGGTHPNGKPIIHSSMYSEPFHESQKPSEEEMRIHDGLVGATFKLLQEEMRGHNIQKYRRMRTGELKTEYLKDELDKDIIGDALKGRGYDLTSL